MAGLVVPFPSSGTGLVPVMNVAQMQEMEKREAEAVQMQPVIQGLAHHVKQCFDAAYQAKQHDVEERLLQCVRQRRGEYDPDVLSRIKASQGSEIYMMLTANKCRAASSWLKDVMFGTKDQKPWDVEPTKEPELDPARQPEIAMRAAQEAMMFEMQLGMPVVTPDRMREFVSRVRDEMLAETREQADEMMKRMSSKMEDQLQEGGFYEALSGFLDDLVTFPFAVMKGPVARKTKQLQWIQVQQQPAMLPGPTGAPPGGPQQVGQPQQPQAPQQGQPPQGQPPMGPQAMPPQYELKVEDKISLHWERVDPFNFYWAPHATEVDDGYTVERHRLTRGSLNELIDVEGYDSAAIRAVLDDHGRGGLKDWLSVDSSKADAEGKSLSAMQDNPEATIDALQFWGSVQGKMLLEWGMDEQQIPDPLAEYPCEIWLIGRWVVKATLNPDPCGRKPYYKTCYEKIPGSWDGNGVCDLVRDTQAMCNSAARALSNNMGIASGPMVYVNVERLATGEDATQMFPWRVWQGKNDDYGSVSKPIEFFQPTSNAEQLMAIYEKFSVLADEYSGVPRYMTGDAPAQGAGRTASGMSMLMGNAGKSIKQVVGNVDIDVTQALIERLYYYNMKYSDDPELKGDVRVVARGVNVLVAKEQAQVRMNEILNIVASNPIFLDIVGPEPIADLLREVTKPLNMDIVPPKEVIRARAIQQAQQMQIQQQMEADAMAEGGGEDGPPKRGGKKPGGGGKVMPGNRQRLTNGAPVTDNFAPSRQRR